MNSLHSNNTALPNRYKNLSRDSETDSPNSHTRDARVQAGEEGSRNPQPRTVPSSSELEV